MKNEEKLNKTKVKKEKAIIDVDTILDMAKSELENFKEITAKVIFEAIDEKTNKKGLAVMIVIWKNRKEKEYMKEKLRETLVNLNLDKYWTVMEAWVSAAKDDEFTKMPSRDINRKECIIVNEIRKDRKNKCLFQLFNKNGDNIEYEDNEMLDNKAESTVASSFDIWESIPELNKKHDETVIKHNKKVVENHIKFLTNKYLKEFKAACESKDSQAFEKVAKKVELEMEEFRKKQDSFLLEDVEESDEELSTIKTGE